MNSKQADTHSAVANTAVGADQGQGDMPGCHEALRRCRLEIQGRYVNNEQPTRFIILSKEYVKSAEIYPYAALPRVETLQHTDI
ncbi:MAG: hypothetical protein ACLTDF_13005 [Coprococcus sp.]